MPIRTIRKFIQFESASGIVLFSVALLALILDNSVFRSDYQSLLNTSLGFNFGFFRFSASLVAWVNEGLMTIFFLLVGLEIKREIIEGELNSVNKVMLPGIAALGGMVAPALIFFLINRDDPMALRGWAIPTATDIAFALGVLSLLRKRIPTSLKIFLTALAIFDDIGAVIIIAIFYTHKIYAIFLGLETICLLILILLNYFKVKRISIYMVVGFLLWFCMLKSGVHAVLAGIILALSIPIRGKDRSHPSPLKQLENKLHPWVAFVILPIFGFTNAGVSFAGVTTNQLFVPLSLGIICGLFWGKQFGIFLATWLAVKTKIAKMPSGSTWISIYGVSLICGIGFTMSLFIGTLAFANISADNLTLVRFGVLSGSFLSGLLGYFVLRLTHPIRAGKNI